MVLAQSHSFASGEASLPRSGGRQIYPEVSAVHWGCWLEHCAVLSHSVVSDSLQLCGL